MEIVPTTAIALAAVLAIARLGPQRGLWAFLAVTPLGAAAAFNLPALGGASVLVADMAALALLAVVILRPGGIGRLLATVQPPRPGFLLTVLIAFAVFATLFFPRLFAHQTEVFGIARIAGEGRIVIRPLQPTTGNVTQLLRLGLGAAVFLALATAFRRAPEPRAAVTALAVAAWVHVGLGFLDLATFTVGVPELLEPIRTANYAMAVNHVMVGLKRMVGGFPEASAFGYYTMGLMGFWAQYWFDRGRLRAAPWILAALVLVLILSTSTSAYVGAALFLLLFLALNWQRFARREVGPRVAAILGGLVVALPVTATSLVMAYQLSPEVAAYLDRILLDKLGSDSGVERMSWNVQAFRNFLDTWTVGAGLGSVRASNWLLANLASLGVVGTLLYAAFLVSVLRAAPPRREGEAAIVVRALRAGCVALIARALVTKPTPDLDLLFFTLAGLAVGLSRGAELRGGAVRRARAAPAEA